MSTPYDYLTAIKDDGETVLQLRTHGCGCCSDYQTVYNRKQALEHIKEQEQGLKDELIKLRELRARVRKEMK